MVNNSTNINKMNNHLKPLNTRKTIICGVGNLGYGLTMRNLGHGLAMRNLGHGLAMRNPFS